MCTGRRLDSRTGADRLHFCKRCTAVTVAGISLAYVYLQMLLRPNLNKFSLLMMNTAIWCWDFKLSWTWTCRAYAFSAWHIVDKVFLRLRTFFKLMSCFFVLKFLSGSVVFDHFWTLFLTYYVEKWVHLPRKFSTGVNKVARVDRSTLGSYHHIFNAYTHQHHVRLVDKNHRS